MWEDVRLKYQTEAEAEYEDVVLLMSELPILISITACINYNRDYIYTDQYQPN